MEALATLLNELGRSFVDFSLAMLLQSTLLILFLWILDRCLRKRVRAGIRYGLWMLVLVKLVLPTSFSLPTSPSYWLDHQVTDVLPAVSQPAPPVVPHQTLLISQSPQAETIPTVSAAPKKSTQAAPAETPVVHPVASVAPPQPVVMALPRAIFPPPPIALEWQAVMLLLWFTVVLAALVFLVKRVLFLRALLRQCTDADADLKTILAECRERIVLPERVSLKVMPLAGSPSVCGLRRYTILIPQQLIADLDKNHLRSIFLHELAHIQRGDLWINLAQTLLQIVYFYNPLLWIANGIIRRTREQAVDEQVLVAMADDADEYPQTLLHISQLAFQRPMLSLRLVGVVESKRALCERIRTIARRPFPKKAGVGLIGFLVMILAVGTLLPMAKGQRQAETAIEKLDVENHSDSSKIEGIVRDPQGHPREFALIGNQVLKPWDDRYITDEQGRFILEDYDPQQKTWVVYCQAAGRWGFFDLPSTPGPKPLHVGLPYKNASVEGRVVGPDGKGIAGKKVELVLRTESGQPFVWFNKAKTDRHGRYGFGAPCGQGLSAVVRLAGSLEDEHTYQTQPLVLDSRRVYFEMPHLVIGPDRIQPGFDQNITVDGTVRYQGRVLDEHGRGLPDVKVNLSFDMPDHMSTWGRYVITDSNGVWSRSIPEDHLTVSMGFEHADYYLDGDIRPSQQALRDGSHTVTMKRGVSFIGTVMNAAGEPIDNALVVAREYNSSTPGPWRQIIENPEITRTGSDGRFVIRGLAPGKRKIRVIPQDYAPVVHHVDLTTDMKPMDIVVAPGRDYHAQIVDSNGLPIEGVTIGLSACRIGRDYCHFSRVKISDEQGYFRLTDLPYHAEVEISVGKEGWNGFRLKLPDEFPKSEKHVLYKVPVWRGKVVDAQTGQPVTDFRIANGVVWSDRDKESRWSRFKRPRKRTNDGHFSHTWGGYGISYPFTGQCLIKVMASGYLAQEAPALGLGDIADSLVIRLEKGNPITGRVLTPEGDPAERAQVVLVKPSQKAFIEHGAFNTHFVGAPEDIARCNQKGIFKLHPSKEKGLVVIVHKRGYGQIPADEIDPKVPVTLTAWAGVEVNLEPESLVPGDEISIVIPKDESSRIRWLHPSLTPVGSSVSFEYLPTLPMSVGIRRRFELHNPMWVDPQPGKTNRIELGNGDYGLHGAILGEGVEKIDFTDPRRTHIVAFKMDENANRVHWLFQDKKWIPVTAEQVEPESSFKWLWLGKEQAYSPSQCQNRRFVPTVDKHGSFTFQGLEAGTYEIVVNIHAPLGENVSCGRGVLQQVGVKRFMVPLSPADSARPGRFTVPVRTLSYPETGEWAPDFTVTTLDGRGIQLSDLKGKVILLDFWATWCSPCVDKLDKLQDLHAELGGEKDFVMLGLSADWDEQRWRRFLKERDLPWAQANLGSLDESSITRGYGIGSIPTVVLIDQQGRIVTKTSDTEKLAETIRAVLKG